MTVERGLTTRFVLAFSFATVLVFAGLAVGLDRYGRASRSGPEPAKQPREVTVDNAKELVALWEAEGINGMTLVQATKSFGYETEALGDTLGSGAPFPLNLPNTRQAYLDRVRRGNRAYVAMFTGIFRKQSILMSQADFTARLEQSRNAGLPDISPDGRSIETNYGGYVRRIAPTPEAIDEPVVLDVDASYFDGGTPDELLAQLREADYTYALITYDLASDDASVTAEMRSGLEYFRTRFAGGVAR